MALNIDLEGFGFLSDSEVSKLSPTLKQQPPISPIESESSSGISSLDSDDLKKQLLSSPTISHDDEDQQSDGVMMIAKEDEEKDSEDDEEEDDDEDEDQLVDDGEANENKTETTDDEAKEEKEEFEATPQTAVIVEQPPMVVYQKRDVLDLASNLIRCDPFVQFTVLPENNVSCFFQNRAQYWRLSSSERQEHSLEKCPCCDFTYPSTQQPVQGPMPTAKNANAITDSLKMFLKSNEQMTAMPFKRPINNAQYGGYQMPQQQQQQQPQAPQQYQSHNNGFYNNNTATNYNQAMNPFMNSGSGFGTTLALLNMMNNASRTAATAFQAMSSNSSSANRYFNNVNNGHGLYKQF